MAKKCFYITYVNCNDVAGSAYICAEDLEYRGEGNCNGGYFYSASNGFNINNASEKSGTITQVSLALCTNCAPPGINPSQPYDCLNGGCIPKNTYNTPGAFANLAACQSGCAKNSNCAGECVDPAELAALQQAASHLQSKICG